MDARTNIKARFQGAAAVLAPSADSSDVALHLPAIVRECGIDLFDIAEIFKKTPCVVDSKPGGRFVAKDMREVGGIPLLMTTLLDIGHLHGDCLTVTGRPIAENFKSVKWNPHPEAAIGGPIGLSRDGDFIVVDAEFRTLNVNLTDPEVAERKTKWKPGATNHRSGAFGKYAQQVGPAVDGAVAHPGGAHEKQCYVDI